MRSAVSIRVGALLCVLLLACGETAPNAANPDDAVRMGRSVIDRAIREAGVTNSLAGGRPFTMTGTGTLDKAAEGQSFTPGQPAPGPFRERLAFDLRGGRASREYREDRYDGTIEHITELHGADSTLTLLVHTHGLAVPRRSPLNVAARRALLRRLPHALLAEVSREGATPRWLGSNDDADSVAALLQTGTSVILAFDPADGLLRSLTYDTVIAGRGRTTLSWIWSDWRTLPELGRFPFRYAATVNNQPYIDVFVDSVTLATDSDFAAPASLRPIATQYDSVAATAPLHFQAVASGVFIVPDVRGGFAPLVIERASGIVVVDAPASFPLLGSIPLAETDPGPHPGWVSERFVDAIRQRFPEKPIRHLILTHGHSDHAGGVRAFVAEGATVVAHASLRPQIQALLQVPPDDLADRYAQQPRPLEFLDVQDSLRLDDSIRPIRILFIDPNPHAAGLLAVHLPTANILFLSDLITPAPIDVYPRANHAPLDLAFLRWFDTMPFSNTRILSMHGSGELSREHLDRLRRLSAQRYSVSGR
jgi:glyoxylase-like metal-dependent hydrolase (beta-lactamase superfamily II)